LRKASQRREQGAEALNVAVKVPMLAESKVANAEVFPVEIVQALA
jgi:hypothetical protein